MAELASGIAGLVSLGITVCQGLLLYYNSYKGFRDDIDTTYMSVESVAKALLAIESVVSRGRFSPEVASLVENSVRLCAQGLDTLSKKLDKIKSLPPDGSLKTRLRETKRNMLYPFKESTLVKLREICQDLGDNLNLALDTLNIDAAVLAQQRLDRLSQLTSNLSTEVAAVAANVHSIKLEQDAKAMADIYTWLTPLTTPSQNRHRESLSIKVRQEEGARELLQRPEFRDWTTAARGVTLWCTGLPGIGKTIYASYIIEALRKRRSEDNSGLAYIYFTYKDAELQTPVNIIASILQQLISQSPADAHSLVNLHAQHVGENTRPSVGEIVSLLQDVFRRFSKVYVIVDALDECSDVDDARPLPDLEKLLDDAIHIEVEASPTDIENYLGQRLESTRSIQIHLAQDSLLQETIVSVILEKVNGMFLMARLYLDTLVNKTTRRKIKSALETLPEGLDSIYEELMVRVKLQNPKDHAELAVRVLGWIFHTARPLTVTEIQTALAIEQGDSSLDEDGIPNRDLLVSICAGMVMINNTGDTISLVHYTAQEYFQRSGKRLLDHANKDIAATCMTYLQFDSFNYEISDLSSKDVFFELLKDHPLLGYAAQHWGDHLRQAGDKEANEQAIEILEDEDKVHLICWLKESADNQAKGTYFRPRAQASGLALASSFGLTATLSKAIDAGLSVHEKDSTGQTALHRAVEKGHVDTAALLLKAGSTVNSKDLAGWTALHEAASKADAAIAKLLVDHGADVDIVDGYSTTPLYRAAEAGAEAVVRLLLHKQADVTVANSYLQTALHRAADRGHITVVELLLKHGANAKAKDHYGYTPFYRAADQGFEDIAKLLRSYMSGIKQPPSHPEKSDVMSESQYRGMQANVYTPALPLELAGPTWERDLKSLAGGFVSAVAFPTSDDIVFILFKVKLQLPRLGEAANAEVIDTTDGVVIPGLVDTHRHVSMSLTRGLGADQDLFHFLSNTYLRWLPATSAEDMYTSALVGSLEAIDGGVTTILDSSESFHSDLHAEAELQGLKDSGVRAFFCFSMSQDKYGDVPAGDLGWKARLEHVERMRKANSNKEALVQVALALTQPGTGPFHLTKAELEYAKRHDMLCCSHSCAVVNSMTTKDIIERHKHNLLLPGHVYIHCTAMTPEEVKLVAESGGKVSIATETEMQMGIGIPPIRRCIEAGLKPSLSIDTSAAVAPDLLGQMRLALQMQRCLDHVTVQQRGEVASDINFTARDALIWGSRNGAETVGLGDCIGTLTPGKRADVVFISNKHHIRPSAFPLATAVLHSSPRDVDTVMIDGEIRKRDGVLVGHDIQAVKAKAKLGLQRILKNLDKVPPEMTKEQVKQYIVDADHSTRAQLATAYTDLQLKNDWMRQK
ncbi:26S proteasome non-ATPase regulatory subunit [Paramyrothecium foliicola]|nr:26S proteasome non-ATPase regulatory subunit [Paramyrothecium foliicola]